MGITRHNTEMHGNNWLPSIDRMTVSPDTHCVQAKAAGLISFRFVMVLPISGSQSMVYRSVV